MNRSTLEDGHWQNLLAASAPAFAGETEIPYGLTTRVLARLREETRQQDLMERIGLRALLASLAMLVAAGALTVALQDSNRTDLEPGLRSIVQVQDVPLS